jgi:hypothetical protein
LPFERICYHDGDVPRILRSNALLACAFACASSCGSGDDVTQAQRASGRAGATQPSVSAERADVRLSVDGVPEEPSLRVEVHGSGRARVAPEALLEHRLPNGHYEEVGPYRLIARCDETPTSCLTLTPGAELRPLAWQRVFGDGLQCGCERCRAAEDGTYRFVVRTCDGARIEGEPFEID